MLGDRSPKSDYESQLAEPACLPTESGRLYGLPTLSTRHQTSNKKNIMGIKNILLIATAIFCLSFETRDIPPQDLAQNEWVEATFNAMTPNQRLGQLFMIRAHSNLGPKHVAAVKNLIKKYQVGSLCFFQGTPEKHAQLINEYQRLSKVPLIVAIDGEWGLGMRMKASTISFPHQLMLGAIQDNRLIYDMGVEIARELRRIGIHMNFAPVLDINNNPNNPVINVRSFGEDRYNVAAKGYMYMKGMQDNGIIACAKHFPGHGDTDVDSHADLPVIKHDMQRLDSIELYPFNVLVQHGIESVMIAHLQVPAIDETEHLPTTLSRKAVTNLLREKLGFDGLIVTDAMEMKGVTKYFEEGEVEALALQAGNDMLLLPKDIAKAIKKIKQYVAEGKIEQAQIDKSVKKILAAKYRLGLNNYQPVSLYNVRKDLNTPEAIVLKRKLVKSALTLIRNKNNLIPFRNLEDRKFASLSIGASQLTTFQKTLDKYTKFHHFNLGKNIPPSKGNQLLGQLRNYDVVVVGIHGMNRYASKDFGLTKDIKEFITALQKETQVVLNVFGTAYSLKYFDDLPWLVCAYEDSDQLTEELSAQALFGAFGYRGRLPVSVSPKSKFNAGIDTPELLRMGYSIPEAVGLKSEVLKKIDAIAEEAIDTKATPGCVVLVAKDGKVVYNKAYGYHTYAKKIPTSTSDVFDLASVTKILASTISTMRLHEQGKIDIHAALSNYLPELKKTNKANMIIQDMMAHHAGLKGWIKFYEQTISGSKNHIHPSSKYYKKQAS
ncbi:MAG TPA: beta-N-acetylhexosaminidase, partial [Saprospiraceae bacterium]|nr:beta-N-acetylhexosaminidase [Saprospiraceae bacterium]